MSILGRLLGSDRTEKCCGHHDQKISWISVLNGLMWKNIHFGVLIVIFFFTLASLWYQLNQFYFNGTNILICLHLPLENLN